MAVTPGGITVVLISPWKRSQTLSGPEPQSVASLCSPCTPGVGVPRTQPELGCRGLLFLLLCHSGLYMTYACSVPLKASGAPSQLLSSWARFHSTNLRCTGLFSLDSAVMPSLLSPGAAGPLGLAPFQGLSPGWGPHIPASLACRSPARCRPRASPGVVCSADLVHA